MRWLPGQRGFEVFQGLAGCLTGQPVHQVKIEIVEAGMAGGFDGPVSGSRIVNSAEGVQVPVIEALDTQG